MFWLPAQMYSPLEDHIRCPWIGLLNCYTIAFAPHADPATTLSAIDRHCSNMDKSARPLPVSPSFGMHPFTQKFRRLKDVV